jgi:hypothetical protein
MVKGFARSNLDEVRTCIGIPPPLPIQQIEVELWIIYEIVEPHGRE